MRASGIASGSAVAARDARAISRAWLKPRSRWRAAASGSATTRRGAHSTCAGERRRDARRERCRCPIREREPAAVLELLQQAVDRERVDKRRDRGRERRRMREARAADRAARAGQRTHRASRPAAAEAPRCTRTHSSASPAEARTARSVAATRDGRRERTGRTRAAQARGATGPTRSRATAFALSNVSASGFDKARPPSTLRLRIVSRRTCEPAPVSPSRRVLQEIIRCHRPNA